MAGLHSHTRASHIPLPGVMCAQTNMSLQLPAEEMAGEKRAFFVGSESGEERDHHQLILQRISTLASQNSLKDAIYWFSVAMRRGPVRPEQLSTFVDCIVRNLNKQKSASGRQHVEEDSRDKVFECPQCRGFLSQAVTLTCGHSFCGRCLRLFSKCKLCHQAAGLDAKANVLLCGLLAKWFPEEVKKSKLLTQVDELCKRRRHQEAVTLASDVIQRDPDTAVKARLSRAQACMSLQQFDVALADTEFCLASSCSAEALFVKAMVLQEMGEVDESLQVLLNCLAVDEDFPCAKRQVEKILCNLLSSSGDDVKFVLRETSQNTAAHLRSKTLVADAQAVAHGPAQRQSPHQLGAAASDTQQQKRPGLSRAHSLRLNRSVRGEESLKRVRSAPQLGDQEKATLLKRKLSVSEAEACIVEHKKQGVTKSHAKTCRSVPKNLIDPNDFECSLCMRLLYEPVTTPCGHTFCKNCLERCLDHTPQCPLCKESLKEYLACRKYTVTSVLDVLIQQYLGQEYEERSRTHLQETRELSDLTKQVPIFVCTMAYPTVPCPLHVFEPRYRLMIRRCMDTGTQQFGMCISDPQRGFADYGCMLVIRSVHFLPDGRSVVDTIGGKRFRVLSRGMKDGYSIADIEHLEDTRVADSEELESLQELHDAVYEQARVWFQNLKVRFHNQILQHFGAMPEREADIQATPDGPACCWWLLAVLPIDRRYQLSVLCMSSLKERLQKIQHILTYLQSVPNN
ncbi:LON peptidase N-terminal domain and ring finger 1, like isoform X2 [Entelurus aequoreus]|uniref:LON peptidase N-terminal domain and ring finger 1, like isoform X2 n=1 Tax=Entelurus aequoreus TaxID=161455 RepID=UPI002B1DF600|nr:LON peptidase N-terminal domain and ring finger 1, like isoform X2 [Entelurus aequoreus]